MLRALVLIAGSLVAVDAVRTDSVTIADRVQLIYHPSDFVEVTGSLVIRRGDLGFRMIGSDGMNAVILAADDNAVGLAAYPDHLGAPRDLLLAVPEGSGGRIGFAGVETEEGLVCGEGFVHLVVNGEEVLIPYYPVVDGP